jgi:5'-nucleotidase/UDP-sugar diphosphatase
MLLLTAGLALAADRVVILHTNDWQSRLLGTPNRLYTPEIVGDDSSLGGVARMTTRIDELRSASPDPVLVVDAGDITMGSLFHLVSRETGGELRLMALSGFDAATLGNHDFDFRPSGLAEMIRSAEASDQGLPVLLASNLVTDPLDPRDDDLEQLISEGRVQRTLILERGGVKVGLIGLLGRNATEVMGQAEPVSSRDAVEVATELVAELRAQGCDLVIALSHSGVTVQDDGTWGDEDVDLARAVPGLDAVISGHSHTALEEPILVDGRPVVQAGANTWYVGELTLERDGERWAVADYRLHLLDDQTLGDPRANELVEELQERVGQGFLEPRGFRFEQLVAEVTQPLGRELSDPTLGNLVTDAFRQQTGSDLAFAGNGTLRADLAQGPLQLSDLFLVSPLGIGTVDDSPGYALVQAWFTGEDVKALMEFLLVAYELRGDSYYPRLSGAEVYANTWRVPLDRVHEVDLDGQELEADRLYSVGMTTYVASFLPLVADVTLGLLDPVMRDAAGQPVDSLEPLLVDADPVTPGVQELKAWQALLQHVASRPDADGDGLPELPEANTVHDRLHRHAGLDGLLSLSTWKQRSAVFGPLGLLVGLGLLGLRRLRSSR